MAHLMRPVWRAVGRLESRRLGIHNNTFFFHKSISVAGPQRRWNTSSGLGDSNSAIEGEFVATFNLLVALL